MNRFMCCGENWCLHGYDTRPLPEGYHWEQKGKYTVPIYHGPKHTGPIKVFVHGKEMKQSNCDYDAPRN